MNLLIDSLNLLDSIKKLEHKEVCIDLIFIELFFALHFRYPPKGVY